VRADILIDTSDFTPHDLKAEIAQWMGATPAQRMGVTVQSFSYKRGVPRGLDMIFDCRFLRNPYWVPALRALDGRDRRLPPMSPPIRALTNSSTRMSRPD
jgi:RNase adapter protein RapZ